ncbi:MAG TPA: ribosome maturation factor RimP [Candidatus Aquicultor sp.]|jgi:ribosome maturation factor RimP
MNRDPRADKVEELLEPIVEREGLELVDVELKREPVGLVLRVLLDTKESGVSLDKVAEVSRLIEPALDEADLIAQKYMLEVSSPGIERPLRKPAHFQRFVGSKVFVKTVHPIGKRKQFKGQLVEAGDNSFVVEIDGERFEIPYDDVSKARLQVDIKF